MTEQYNRCWSVAQVYLEKNRIRLNSIFAQDVRSIIYSVGVYKDLEDQLLVGLALTAAHVYQGMSVPVMFEDGDDKIKEILVQGYAKTVARFLVDAFYRRKIKYRHCYRVRWGSLCCRTYIQIRIVPSPYTELELVRHLPALVVLFFRGHMTRPLAALTKA